MSTDFATPMDPLPRLHEELARYGLEAVVLYGSRAVGKARTDSDLDVAVLCTVSPAGDDLYFIAQSLAARIGVDVDLIDLRAASTVLAKEILVNGVVLFESRPGVVTAFKGRVFSDYALLNEERGECIRSFLAA